MVVKRLIALACDLIGGLFVGLLLSIVSHRSLVGLGIVLGWLVWAAFTFYTYRRMQKCHKEVGVVRQYDSKKCSLCNLCV